jgi:hypothetical protein
VGNGEGQTVGGSAQEESDEYRILLCGLGNAMHS